MKKNIQEYFIGIDIGTGSTKAVAMDGKGKIIADSQFYYPSQSPHPGYSEQDPQQIWNAFAKCIKTIVDEVKSQPVSVGLSSAMHSVVVMDKKNKPITPLITWADTRSAGIAQKLRGNKKAKALYENTGTPIHSMTPLCKIIWLKENKPKIFKAAHKFISIKEFIWYKLFKVYEVDHSIASATGLFDIQKLSWYQFSLKLCGINPSQLSDVVPTHFIRKNVDSSVSELMKIAAGTPFCIGASDGCTANVGSYAVAKGTAALTIGTSGAVRIASPEPIYDFASMSFNYLLDEKTFICGGPVNNGGIIVKWLLESFMKISNPKEKDYENLFKLIETVPAGCKGLLFLPYLYGERAPVWDERTSGLFFGVKPYHTKEFFLRAVVEGVCYSMNQVLKVVESSSQNIKQLNVGGGFIHSKTWLQISSDITGKRLSVVESEDSSSIGAALMGMKAQKVMDSYSSLKPKKGTIIKPDLKNHKVYGKYFAVYKNLYESVKELMWKDDEVISIIGLK